MTSGSLFVTNLLKTAYCPAEQRLLTQAVNLFPCCHKINQAAAERMYGKSIDGACELKGERCVVCNGTVTGYAPDQTVRAQADLILGNRERLQEFFGRALDLEKTPEPMDFPGRAAVFRLSRGGLYWMHESRAIFDSTDEDSLIREFIIMTEDDGKVGLTVRFASGIKFEDYMRSRGIALWDGSISEAYRNTTTFHTTGNLQCQKLLAIIIENNKVPAECLYHLQQWVNRSQTKTTHNIVEALVHDGNF